MKKHISRISKLFLIFWYLSIVICRAENAYSLYADSPFAQRYFVLISNVSDRFLSGVLDDSNYNIVYNGNYKEYNDRYILYISTISFSDTSITVKSKNDSIILLKHPKDSSILWLVEKHDDYISYDQTLYLQRGRNAYHEKEYYKVNKNKASRTRHIVRKVELDLDRDKQEFQKYKGRFKP